MYYKHIFLLITLLYVLGNKSHGQYENVWIFGNEAGLDFSSGSPEFRSSSLNANESSASICDQDGRLLFYTDGYDIWNRNGSLMPNGEKLIAGMSTWPTNSTSQGAVIVPIPSSPDKYYIFSLTSYEINPNREANRLYYSIVDMNLNSGLGDVQPAAKGILMDSFLTEMMTAVVGDQCNIWLLVINHYDNQLKAYSITEGATINPPVISDLMPVNFGAYQGYIEASSDRKKIALSRIGLGLYEFNPATGSAKGIAPLVTVKTPHMGHGGIAFSPDNSKLFGSIRDVDDNYQLFQFDLSSNDSATMMNSRFSFGLTYIHAMKCAPDGKIYTASQSPGLGIGVINNPNLYGTAAQFAPYINIGGISWTYNFPTTIAVVEKDTIYSGKNISGACFANVNPLMLHAQNDTTGMNYLWSNGNSGSYISVDTPGTYWVSYHTPPCNFNVDTFHVSFPNGVLSDIAVKASCNNDDNGKAYAYTYLGDTVTYRYAWLNSAGDTISITDTLRNVSSGNYSVRISTANCDTILSFIIPEKDYEVSFITDSIICYGGELTFENTSDTHFADFHWDFGDDQYSSLNGPKHIYVEAGEYKVTLVGIGEICTDTTSQIVIVDPVIATYFQIEPDSVCVGEAIAFSHQIDNITIDNLSWDFGDGSIVNMNDNRLQHAFDISGLMSVTLNALFRVCPESSFTDTVNVFALPKVDLGANTTICANEAPIVLTNHEINNGDTYHFRWNTGDTTESLKVLHPGKYSLTVSSESLGCSTTESIEITKGCYIDIPNAFTPDGDGINDYFFPRRPLSKNISQFKMQVLNRWGQIIFETSRVDGRGWDGNFNGKAQPKGVYIYLVEIATGDRNERYQGNVTLLR